MKSVMFGAVALAVVGIQADAAPLAVEDFGRYVTLEADPGSQGRIVPNGLDGNPISGQLAPDPAVSGIYNWRSPNPWGANRVVTGDLAYPGYISSGGKRLQAFSGGTNFKAVFDTAAPTVFADYVDAGVAFPAIGKTGTTMYLSFLYKITGTITANSQAVLVFQERTADTLHPDTGAIVENYSGRFEFGQSWNNPDIRAQGTVLEPVNNDTHLIVMKIVYNGTTLDGTDQVTFWYDPDLSLPESSQTIAMTATRNMTFTHLSMTGQGTATNDSTKVEFDDLRFGSTWDSVVPVPEPGAVGLLMAAGMLFLRRKRG